jgi:hypothetical protein
LIVIKLATGPLVAANCADWMRYHLEVRLWALVALIQILIELLRRTLVNQFDIQLLVADAGDGAGGRVKGNAVELVFERAA